VKKMSGLILEVGSSEDLTSFFMLCSVAGRRLFKCDGLFADALLGAEVSVLGG
jgi:hypothetical protein